MEITHAFDETVHKVACSNGRIFMRITANNWVSYSDFSNIPHVKDLEKMYQDYLLKVHIHFNKLQCKERGN